MADLSITATGVLASTNAFSEPCQWGETVAAGASVYKSATDGKMYNAECDVLAHVSVYGVALTGGAVNQVGQVQRTGNITIGATVGVGTIYVLSAAAGKICPSADLASTNYVSIIGVGVSATDIQLAVLNTGVQKP